MKTNKGLKKIYLNEFDDYILINPNNYLIRKKFDEFVLLWNIAYKQLKKNHESFISIEKEQKPDFSVNLNDLVKWNERIYQSAIENIDNIFGKDTVKKYFRKLYETISDFQPGEECIFDFIQEMSKALEIIYGSKH